MAELEAENAKSSAQKAKMAELALNVQAMTALIGGPPPPPRGQGDVAGPSGLQRPARVVEPAARVVEPAAAAAEPAANDENEEEDSTIVLGELIISRNANHGRR